MFKTTDFVDGVFPFPRKQLLIQKKIIVYLFPRNFPQFPFLYNVFFYLKPIKIETLVKINA